MNTIEHLEEKIKDCKNEENIVLENLTNFHQIVDAEKLLGLLHRRVVLQKYLDELL